MLRTCGLKFSPIGTKRLVIGVIYRHLKPNLEKFQSAMENTIELLNPNSLRIISPAILNLILQTNHDVKVSLFFNTPSNLGCSQI